MTGETKLKLAITALLVLVLVSGFMTIARSADYTRDGGTADELCCSDKACTQIISQHADRVRAVKACEKLTDADGVTRYVRSNAFRITASSPPPPTTGSATLRWTPPTQNTNGSALTNLAGYWIAYGQSPTALTQTIAVSDAAASSYAISGLTAGTWHFSVRSYNSLGAESAASNVASKAIP